MSRNQLAPAGPNRGANEAEYFQTSAERYVSFLPEETALGPVFGEAYRGYATEASDGAGGLACTAIGIAKVIANLQSACPALSDRALQESTSPPDYLSRNPDAAASFYSKGFRVERVGDEIRLGHGGMTNHCGGVIGHHAEYQYAAVTNWNNAGPPWAAEILDTAVKSAVAAL